MKNIFFSLFVIALIATSCKSDDEGPQNHDHETDTSLDYSAQIMSPDVNNKKLDEEIHIHAVLESGTKQTVHHVKVRIYNKADHTLVVYEKPEKAHVHNQEGKFELHDDLKLSIGNGFLSDSNWVIEAKVWGHEAGEDEVMIVREFHIE